MTRMVSVALSLTFLLVTGFSVSSKSERYADMENEIGNEEQIRWMLLPGEDGQVRVAILKGLEPPDSSSQNEVYFLLWTRQNPFMAERRILNGTCFPKFEYFDGKRQTKIMVHGFGDAAKESIMYPIMKDAFLASGDYNVIAVDWARLAAAPWYHVAIRNTEMAARQTAAMIDYQVEVLGADIADFHLLGFSLGAHVVGITGQRVKSGRIQRITGTCKGVSPEEIVFFPDEEMFTVERNEAIAVGGVSGITGSKAYVFCACLDPAQVLYQTVPNNLRLDRSDAELVEIIHTSGGYLAFIEEMGHRDFFPNGGFWPQPGCDLDFIAVCSHQRAYYYLAEGIKYGRGFSSTLCSDWSSYKTGMCDTNERISMWNDYNSSVSGKFFLDTNAHEPFSMD